MSKQKQVWRINSGNGVPNDLGGKVMFTDGILAEPWDSDFTDKRQWELINNDPANYGAYRTTRTKAAKYKRVECKVCKGKGKRDLKDWITKTPFTGVCIYCNGKGYTLEEIKC